jgi:hypothetical protein
LPEIFFRFSRSPADHRTALSPIMSGNADGPPPLPSNPDDDAGPRIIGATMTVTLLAFITWSLRIYVRLVMVRNPGLDVSHHH